MDLTVALCGLIFSIDPALSSKWMLLTASTGQAGEHPAQETILLIHDLPEERLHIYESFFFHE